MLAAIAFSSTTPRCSRARTWATPRRSRRSPGTTCSTPRQGYPLYFAVTGLLVHVLPVEAARAANLGVGRRGRARRRPDRPRRRQNWRVRWLAGLVAGLAVRRLLHVLVAGDHRRGLRAAPALRQRVPAGPALVEGAAVDARGSRCSSRCCALGFGNHLSMVLLLPGFALLLLTSAPERPAVDAAAARRPAGGGHRRALRAPVRVERPVARGRAPRRHAATDLLRTFWFDVTKSDWRANMVYGIPDVDAGATGSRCTGSTSASSSAFRASWRPSSGSPALLRRQWRLGAMLLTLVVRQLGVRVHLQRRRRPRVLPAVALGGRARGRVRRRLGVVRARRRRSARRRPRSRRSSSSPTRRGGPTTPIPPWTAARTASRRWSSTGWSPAWTRAARCWARDLNWQLHNGLDYYVEHTRPDLISSTCPRRSCPSRSWSPGTPNSDGPCSLPTARRRWSGSSTEGSTTWNAIPACRSRRWRNASPR